MGQQSRQFCTDTAASLRQLWQIFFDRGTLDDTCSRDLFFTLKELRAKVSVLRDAVVGWSVELALLDDDESFRILAQRVEEHDYLSPPFDGDTLTSAAVPTLNHIKRVLVEAVVARRAPVVDDFHPLQDVRFRSW